MQPSLSCRRITAVVCLLLLAQPGSAWSNRGHRFVNLLAAESLPPEMPAFLHTQQAVAQISYLGPEPDRWRPESEPELSNVHSPNHVFRLELAVPVGPLPRRRTEFLALLERLRAANPGNQNLRSERIGTLPWQAEEVYERLQSAFRSCRIASGDIPMSDWPDEAPIDREDLPSIQASVLFYAGELGHYIADASQPLHDTVNTSGWSEKDNPHGYTTAHTIHHQLELAADNAIGEGAVKDKNILPSMPAPHLIGDPFAAILNYVQAEAKFMPQVYELEKAGAITGSGSRALQTFIAARMEEGGTMLRDLIYSAWIHSGSARPSYAPVVRLQSPASP